MNFLCHVLADSIRNKRNVLEIGMRETNSSADILVVCAGVSEVVRMFAFWRYFSKKVPR